MPEQVGNENIKRSLRQASFASPVELYHSALFFSLSLGGDE